ncbi:MAG: UvrD-helicase domain-containing protein [Proteobacteria bacterium]|nr:UvrD-helicase domain-containing protein [Pseudomonadota bacterium]
MLTDLELLQADGRSRAAALNVKRSAIVQAPAGSGKTELLIQRYLKLLAIVNNPEEILAITFTRKAASEMKLRVIGALRLARDGVAPAAEHERTTFRAASAALARDRKLAWNLIQSPGRMRIQTVDAFGAGIARSLPLSSGLGGIGATLTGAEMSAMYRAAAAATFDNLDATDGAGESVACVLMHLDNHTGLYISHISRMLAYRDQWLAMTGSGLSDPQNAIEARRQLEKNIENIVVQQLTRLSRLFTEQRASELLALISYAIDNLHKSDKPDHPLCGLAPGNKLPGRAAGDRVAWQAISGLLLTKGGDWRKSINKNDGFPAGDKGQKKSLYALIDQLRELPDLHQNLLRIRSLPEPRYVDQQWDVLLALLKLLPLAVGELQRLFSERGVSDHIQVALAANHALGPLDQPGEIALMLDYQLRHLLVDEMQDTSLSQYGLLKKLTAGWSPGDGRTLFCVGDPMQSIYRFRDAEVGQFLLARLNGIGGVKLDSLILRRNFRSGEHLVHWFNTIFSQILPSQDDVSSGAISYSESVPVEEHANSGEYRIHPLFDASPDEEARYTLEVIRECLHQHPDEGVAVLVRSRTILPALTHQLRLAAIPYQALEIDKLTDLPEIIDLLALTRALCHESDRLAWLALLRGPWVGLCWSDLHSIVKNDASSTVVELLDDQDRMATLSVDAVERLTKFRERMVASTRGSATETLRDRVERAWYALAGPSLLRDAEQLDNVYRFLDVIGRIESAGSLADVNDLERMLDRERVSSRLDPDCRLQIMTMHKAKGLQFDHVVLHGLGRAARVSDRAVLSWLINTGSDGRSEMIISTVGPRSELENDPLHQFIEATQRDKERLELDRLLYVACTRAVKSLQLIGNVGLTADGQSYRQPDGRSLFHRLWPAIEPVVARAFAESGIAESAASYAGDEAHLVAPVLRRLKSEPPSSAPPLPGRRGGADQSAAGNESQVEYHWVGSAARHAGTIVHRWLQRMSDGIADIDDKERLHRTSGRWARALGVREEEIEAVCDRVAVALRKISSDEKGRWVLFGDGETELAVSGVIDGQLRSVVIDRIRIDDEGVHWIVDYKTSTHEGGDLEGFLEQEAARYRPQLDLYAALYRNLTDAPVRTALYFPLLQKFCEL